MGKLNKVARRITALAMAAMFATGAAIVGLLIKPLPAYSEALFTREKISSGGIERVFYYHLPRRYSGRSTPIVFLFHGGGGNAMGIAEDTHIAQTADENDFIAVTPEGVDHRWNYGVDIRARSNADDVQFVKDMMTYMQQRFNVDAARMYFAGFSEGGWLTQYLTYFIPHNMAAAGVVCALQPTVWHKNLGTEHPRVPIVFMLGTGDPRMHWNGGVSPNGTPIISADATVWGWIRSDRVSHSPRTENLPDRCTSDDSRVEVSYYTRPSDGLVDVAYYKVIGGGHAWPGAVRTTSSNGNVNEDINGTQRIWDFFRIHSK